MASGPYFLNLEKCLNNYYEAGTWFAMLMASYTENRDTHDFMDDVIAAGTQVANGNGYTTGGKSVTTPTVVFTGATNLYTVTFPQVVWNTATFTAAFCIWYKEIGTNAQDEPGYVNDFGGNVTATNADFTVPASDFTLNFPD